MPRDKTEDQARGRWSRRRDVYVGRGARAVCVIHRRAEGEGGGTNPSDLESVYVDPEVRLKITDY